MRMQRDLSEQRCACFWGYLAFRVVIPIWGAFVGFGVGAGLIASFCGDGFLQTGLGWIVGIAVALLFAVLAYLFYEVAVVIAMGSIGFTLGVSLMVALDVSWTWTVILVGLALGRRWPGRPRRGRGRPASRT